MYFNIVLISTTPFSKKSRKYIAFALSWALLWTFLMNRSEIIIKVRKKLHEVVVGDLALKITLINCEYGVEGEFLEHIYANYL